MFDNLGGFLQASLTIVTFATLVGLGLMRGTVTNLRENLKDARDEIADKDRRLTEAEAEILKGKALNASQAAEFRGHIASQASDLLALGRVVTGEAHWVAIGNQLDEHHKEAKVHWATDEQTLHDILEALGPS